jgi:uncharacterized protein
MRGQGMFLHTDAHDRPTDVYGGTATLTSGGNEQSCLLLPFTPRGRRLAR